MTGIYIFWHRCAGLTIPNTSLQVLENTGGNQGFDQVEGKKLQT